MSAPSIPSNYTINQNLAGGMSIATMLSGGVRTELDGGITMELVGDPAKPVTTNMGMAVTMTNFPTFTFAQLKEMMRKRIRMPVQLRFGMSVFPFNLFGIDVVQFSICGEPQVILDDYVPNAYERCAVECEPCEAP